MNRMPDTQSSGLTIRGMETKAVKVPLTFPLGTSAATVREAPLLLLDLLTEEGVTGRAYLFGYTPSGARAMAAHLQEAVALWPGEGGAAADRARPGAALRAARRDRHAAHGAFGARHRAVGRVRDPRRCRWRRCLARGPGRCAPTTAAGSA